MTLKATLAYNMRGAQGQQGFGTRAGAGLPSATTAPNAVDGDSYVDYLNAAVYAARTGGTWGSPTTLLGATGSQGTPGDTSPNLSGSSAATFAPIAWTTGAALTASYQAMPLPGTTTNIPQFLPTWASSLASATFIVTSTSTTSAAFQLIDATSGTIYYTSSTYSTGTINPVSGINVALPANGKYQWQAKGSGSASIIVLPVYTYPTGNGISIGDGPYAQLANVTLTATPTVMRLNGSANATAYFVNPTKNAYLYYAALTNSSAAAASFTLYNSTGAAAVATYAVPAQSSINVGPLANGTVGITAANTHIWRVTGSANGNFSAQWQVYT